MGGSADMVDTVGIDKDKAYCPILADIDCIICCPYLLKQTREEIAGK